MRWEGRRGKLEGKGQDKWDERRHGENKGKVKRKGWEGK